MADHKPIPLTNLGEFTATTYGPPWEGIQGTGTTATGIDLSNGPQRYIIAVDPAVIPLGSIVRLSANPVGAPLGIFVAADTGSAVTGKHIDIYDWKGRAHQLQWGTKRVTIQMVKRGDGSTDDTVASDPTKSVTGNASLGDSHGIFGSVEGTPIGDVGDALDNNPVTDTFGDITGGVGDVVGGAVDAAEAVPEFLGKLGGALFSRDFWWRVLKIVIGLGLVALAVKIILHATGLDDTISKAGKDL